MFANAKKPAGTIKHVGLRIEDCFNFLAPVPEDSADRVYVVEYEGDIPDGVFPLVTSAAWSRYIVAMPVRMPANLIGVRGRVTFADLVNEGAFGGFESTIVDVKYHPAANGGVAVMVRWEKNHRTTSVMGHRDSNPNTQSTSSNAIGDNAKLEYVLDDEGLLNVNAIFADRPGRPKAPKTKTLQAAWARWRTQGGGLNYQTFVDSVYPMVEVEEDDEDLTVEAMTN